MCGIAGALTDRPPATLVEAVERMTRRQAHRGPDDRRVVTVASDDVPVVLGFNRLAILDRSAAAGQPMRDEATGSWLVFNGEIYNFRALRAELEAGGRRFRTRGDSEVLLAALVTWGPAALARLRGMYAFGFFDGRTRRLLLGRDPFGIKPLLYQPLRRGLAFASELRALQAGALAPLSLDRPALQAYLHYGAIPEPHTMASEVRSLPAGHVLTVEADGRRSEPERVVTVHDALAMPENEGPFDHERALTTLHETLAESVRAHCVSDVPLGILLSGGVDSTAIASVAGAAPAPTFLTVGFDETVYSEAAVARATASRLHGRHEVVSVTDQDVLALVPAALDAMDQPTVDGINTFVIARAAAARGITVLLSGIGGDELFGGYTSFTKAPLLAGHAAWLAPLGRGAAALGLGDRAQWDKVGHAGAVRSVRDAYVLQRGLGWGMPAGPHAAAAPPYGLPACAWNTLDVPAGTPPFRQVSLLEMSFYMRNQLLRDADVFASAHGVEMRVPFLDPAVLAAAWGLPAAAHVGPFGGRKRLLRALVERLHPDHRLPRAKRGFVLPWAQWLHGPLGERLASTLHDRERLRALGLPGALGARLMTAFRGGDARVGWARLWSLFVLLEWQARHRLEVTS